MYIRLKYSVLNWTVYSQVLFVQGLFKPRIEQSNRIKSQEKTIKTNSLELN